MSISVTIVTTDNVTSRPAVIVADMCISDAADAVNEFSRKNGVLIVNCAAFEKMRDALWNEATRVMKARQVGFASINNLDPALFLLARKLGAQIWMDVSY